MQRPAIKKSTKFEVLKRDSFTCQYCGKSAPNVVLEIDHILPICKGGNNNVLNLITSCYDCNRGKSGKLLTDMSTITAQKLQLKILNEKKNQFEMLKKWREELSNLDNEEFNYINTIWSTHTGYIINEHGRKNITKLIKKYGLNEVLISLEISVEHYFKKSNAEEVFAKISSILRCRKLDRENPKNPRVFYILGILKNRFNISGPIRNEIFALLCRIQGDEYFLEAEDSAKYQSSLNWVKKDLVRIVGDY